MKNILLLIVYALYIPGSVAGVDSACMDGFVYHEFENLLARALVDNCRTARDLKWFNNKKQGKEFEKDLKEIVNFWEYSFSQRELLRNLNISSETIIDKISEIIKYTKQAPAEDAVYFQKITLAVLAMFAKHLPIAAKEEVSQVDWPRLSLILKHIIAFDSQNPRFSLYKIKRVIEGRYSLREFILCRK